MKRCGEFSPPDFRLQALIVCLSCLLSACVTRTPATLQAVLTPAEARQTLQGLQGESGYRGLPITTVFRIGLVKITHEQLQLDDLKWEFRDLNNLVMVKDPHPGFWALGIDKDYLVETGVGKKGEARAQQIADAILTLRNEATRVLTASDIADLRRQEAAYGANPPPATAERLRSCEIQAEDAVRSKDFGHAVSVYEAALESAPWWSQGHFNLSLVYAALEDYQSAIREMRFYLALVPDAPNTRAAQDSIYQWEGRLGK